MGKLTYGYLDLWGKLRGSTSEVATKRELILYNFKVTSSYSTLHTGQLDRQEPQQLLEEKVKRAAALFSLQSYSISCEYVDYFVVR